MAETYLNAMGGDRFEATSAGLEPTSVNPLVVEVMREDGFDISGNRTRSVFDLYRAGRMFDVVITVCKSGMEPGCPVFPGIVKRLHWDFDDPAALGGSREERLAGTRRIRDAIKARLREWVSGDGAA